LTVITDTIPVIILFNIKRYGKTSALLHKLHP